MSKEMFKCPACGHGYFRVVAIRRQDKPDFQTEFVACSRCKVMQWTPGDEPRNKADSPLLKTWGTKRSK